MARLITSVSRVCGGKFFAGSSFLLARLCEDSMPLMTIVMHVICSFAEYHASQATRVGGGEWRVTSAAPGKQSDWRNRTRENLNSAKLDECLDGKNEAGTTTAYSKKLPSITSRPSGCRRICRATRIVQYFEVIG
jgi:hypothetical protein